MGIEMLFGPWRAYQRRMDIKVLWPACKQHADNDLDDARLAFTSHALYDAAWTSLGPEEMKRRIEELT